ncbi:MAG: sigma-70 family RNA polymerase sigma factor [Planctomycetes bacterium]|nr:sigma-70 family RNA polymerase sigma factor [Planctomycetota bacterium]
MPPPADDDLERWITAFRGPLIGLLASWGNDWGAAEEVAADAFAEAWVGRARFDAEPSDLDAAGSWLRGIAFRLHEARRRRAAVRRAEPIDREHAERLAAPVEDRDERRELLVAAFAQLAPQHQTVLRMHYLEASSAREVAALLRITPKAVEDRLYQARRALRERVERIAAKSAAGARR